MLADSICKWFISGLYIVLPGVSQPETSSPEETHGPPWDCAFTEDLETWAAWIWEVQQAYGPPGYKNKLSYNKA